jgi:citrate lyase subunit beta/citryl-CoA lyase
MRRSLLFMPGNNPAMLQNSDIFDSDAVIYDLEDAVSVTEKDSARILVSQFLKTKSQFPMEVVIRINGLDTEFYMDDLLAVLSNKIDTIMLPKASVKDLILLDEILTKLERERALTKRIHIIPIIELASSVLEIEEIVKQNRVNGVLLGAEDLTSDLDVQRTKQGDEILYPRMRLAIACAAYKIDSIDTPFTDTADEDGLLTDCKKALGLGFTSKSAIHPSQVGVINDIFVPSPEKIKWALRVQSATQEAEKKGLGVFSLDGKMVDKPVIQRANKILEKAKRYHLI